MKKVVFAILSLGMILWACEKEDLERKVDAKTKNNVSYQINGWPTIIFGTKSKPCRNDNGCYCDGNKGICLLINPEPLSNTPNNLVEGQGYGNWIIDPTNSKFTIQILDNFELDQNSNFSVENDYELPSDVCAYLGYTSIILSQGEYQVDYSNFQHGEVIVDIIIN